MTFHDVWNIPMWLAKWQLECSSDEANVSCPSPPTTRHTTEGPGRTETVELHLPEIAESVCERKSIL